MIAIAVFSAALAIAPPVERLTRIADTNEKGEMNPDATMGQVVVGYYIELQAKHPTSVPVMSDDFTCKKSVPQILKAIASKRARGLSKDVRDKLAANDQAALESLAIDAIGELDGIDSAKIRADEAIGPGVYRPAISVVAYTISRCKFYR
jgi:hypothetical protein